MNKEGEELLDKKREDSAEGELGFCSPHSQCLR